MLNKKILIAVTIMLVAVCQLFNCKNSNAYPSGQCHHYVTNRDSIAYCEFDNGDVCYYGPRIGMSCNFKNK